jgi:translation initiation factor 2B subunit (eIF-2B alpha/beta/delta family)
MMKQKYVEKVSSIATDNTSSAQQILRDAIDLLVDFAVHNASAVDFTSELKSLCAMMSKAQPQMPALSNICKLVVAASERMDSDALPLYLEALREKISDASSKAAAEACKFILQGRSYATISQSEFVIKSFEFSASQRKFVTVYVMESRPLFEGRQTAKALMKLGHRAILVSDASIGTFIQEIDSAFIGADAILSDGTVVNKVGSYPLALCCDANEKDLYVVTSVLKFSADRTAKDFVNKEESPHEIYANPDFEVKNLYFDLVKPQFFKSVIVEVGSVSLTAELNKLEEVLHSMYN